MRMQKLEYEVRFLTPAFLGNAEQTAQWRTPPFKALLRQWWRVAYAADHAFDVDLAQMRREEGVLFGNAWLSHRQGRKEIADHRKSLIRLRLNRWNEGGLRTWQGLEQERVVHPEVERTKYRVGPHAYLGYGPLDGRGNTQLDKKRKAAIQAGGMATLSLAWPRTHIDPEVRKVLQDNDSRLASALWLMDRYGTLGGRSRNAWGSLSLTPLGDTPSLERGLKNLARPWRHALKLDWPHALGEDDKGILVWQTQAFDDWKGLMRDLAIIKIGLRTQFVFTTGRNAPSPEKRHWLSHPVTNHNVAPWRRRDRLPNSLRFKVRVTAGNEMIAVIFHVPCLPPKEFSPERDVIFETWKKVHEFLDELTAPAASRRYTMIPEAPQGANLKASLDKVVLNRILE